MIMEKFQDLAKSYEDEFREKDIADLSERVTHFMRNRVSERTALAYFSIGLDGASSY